MSITAALEALANTENIREQELFDLLRIASVSTAPEHTADMRAAGEWIRAALAKAGCTASLEETAGHPLVFAEYKAGDDKPTILVYGHYDVQPADQERDGWTHAPFDPVVRDGNVYARGASDDKGQVLCWVHAAQAWAQAGGAPVNLKFLIEGEEEIGSKNLEQWIVDNKERLAADIVAVSDSGQFAPGAPALTYGLRGLLYVELRVYGACEDVHSGGYGGTIMNPATALCRMIAGLHDEDGRVLIDGFYDGVRPLEPWEREAFAALPHNDETYAKELGVESLFGEKGFTTLERVWARPTCEVNGLFGGFQGHGAKTVLPCYAGAKISMRLVPDQNPAAIYAGLRQTLERLTPPGVRIDVGAPGPGATATGAQRKAPLNLDPEGDPAVVVDRESAFAIAARTAIATGFGAEPVWMRSGGSIPVVSLFKHVLGLDTVLMGYGLPDDGAHGPDEKFCLADYHRGARASAQFLHEVAGLNA